MFKISLLDFSFQKIYSEFLTIFSIPFPGMNKLSIGGLNKWIGGENVFVPEACILNLFCQELILNYSK